MQDFIGSVRRSLVFRPDTESSSTTAELNSGGSPPLTGTRPLVDKINSCIRKSRIFAKPLSSPPLPMAPPIRYRKGELIGCGAFGQVYMGMNLDSGELLAIKQVLIAANGASKERAQAHVKDLEEEVKLLKNLSHTNIVVIRTYTEQLLLGLEYLHSNGIMHRDIKGANILVDNKGCIKLADFGASKQVVELATISGAKSMKGTPYWMAPEVIRQTGHSFSADIWSVGCTVIEMATGKPPWSQQYQEVAALFHIGSTKSHPEIPEHLSDDAKDFLLKCLQKEPDMRLDASELLKHPFVIGGHGVSDTATSFTPQSQPTQIDIRPLPSVSGSGDLCNLGSLNFSVNLQNSSETQHLWRPNDGDADMCQIDSSFSISNQNPMMTSGEFDNDQNVKHEFVGDLMGKFDECLEPDGVRMCTEEPAQCNRTLSCEISLSEDDDELTESKIKAFLDEKALELKKLQTPLFEEFYNSMIATSSSSFPQGLCNETSPNYLKLPPKSKSPSRGVQLGVSSPVTDTETPGSTGRSASNVVDANDATSRAISSAHADEQNVVFVDTQPESSSRCVEVSERQRKWKEELVEELERKREMMRQAGIAAKTSSSPKDRALNRQREKTRFASSPGK
ncbi:unnamed protein product [Linum tenue]|uniref:mitogen-activated protein kinase kinase kinase n=1 Tax=Linum tenue TaxID=586396 RepID=A0AAV0R2D8_9ROSI|nr:unnamed protein product [Linum tenue]